MQFLKNNARFSFKLDGKSIWDFPTEAKLLENENQLVKIYDFGGGLKVTNISHIYENGAYEWVNYFENTGDAPTGVISDLWDCDCSLPFEYEDFGKWQAYFPDENQATKIYAPSGSSWTMEEFYCDVDKIKENKRINHIYPGEEKEYCATGGRSSVGNAPFFNISKNNKGYIFAIGWSGQWSCRIGRSNNSIEFKSNVQNANFRLLPGEKFRTSSILIMPYEGDFATGQNKWRRMIKNEFSPIGKCGRDKYAPLSFCIWGGMKTESVLKRIRKVKEEKLPFEYMWMDAGWYGVNATASPDEFEGDWATSAGDWRVSKHIHPNGLSDISEELHNSGIKFLLWFEPEVVNKSVPLAKEHPDWCLVCDSVDPDNMILNLGNDAAWEYCFEMLSNFIDKLNIDFYRQDFNLYPLNYWLNNDSQDRLGITEIKHINGLYRLWDALLEKYPTLLIDNCASGGRRIDIETLRRSIPLWRSDYQCSANYDIEAAQCHSMAYNSWLPYCGTGTGRIYDEYRVRSSYAGALAAHHSFSEREEYAQTEEEVNFLRKYMSEYLRVRPYLSEDFYPLTSFNTALDVWCAMQFDRQDNADGIIQVFRRGNSPYNSASFMLREIDENAEYSFEDCDSGDTVVISGKSLLKNGFTVDGIEKRKAKIYFYKKTKTPCN